MSKKMTIEQMDEKIKALQEMRRKAVIEQKKRIANETKNLEIKRNVIRYNAMSNFLRKKGLGDGEILSLGEEGLRDIIFEKKPKPSAGA